MSTLRLAWLLHRRLYPLCPQGAPEACGGGTWCWHRGLELRGVRREAGGRGGPTPALQHPPPCLPVPLPLPTVRPHVPGTIPTSWARINASSSLPSSGFLPSPSPPALILFPPSLGLCLAPLSSQPWTQQRESSEGCSQVPPSPQTSSDPNGPVSCASAVSPPPTSPQGTGGEQG